MAGRLDRTAVTCETRKLSAFVWPLVVLGAGFLSHLVGKSLFLPNWIKKMM
jgi:hypothetical protein